MQIKKNDACKHFVPSIDLENNFVNYGCFKIEISPFLVLVSQKINNLKNGIVEW